MSNENDEKDKYDGITVRFHDINPNSVRVHSRERLLELLRQRSLLNALETTPQPAPPPQLFPFQESRNRRPERQIRLPPHIQSIEPVMVSMTFEFGPGGFGGPGGLDLDALMEQSLESTIQRHPHRDIKVNITKYENDDETSCSICQDAFHRDEDVVCLSCSHIFHPSCIKEWGKHKPECPVCRSPIPFNDPRHSFGPDNYETIEL